MTGLVGIRQHTTVVVWALPTILIAATAVLAIVGEGLDPVYLAILTISISIPFSAAGALIVSRQPRQAVGWVMWSIGGLMVLELFLESYAQVRLLGEVLPGRGTARAISEPFWVPPAVLPVTLLPLLFPTGKPLSARWRWIGWLAVAALVVIVVPPAIFFWFHRQELVNDQQFHTPAALGAMFPVGVIGILVAAIASIISVIVRLRRSAGVEREQMKWFLAGVATALCGLVVNEFAPWRNDVNGLALMALPVTIGIAILRYRLYEIDRLINRTLVYAVLTASLAFVYLVLVIGLGGLMRAIVGESSNLVVAGSTLAVAALIRPLRARIQTIVDRRFYRHKYDVTRTLEAFSSRLRDEIDLDTLTAALRATVMDTMQPESVSLWLRKTARRSDRRNDSVTIGT
ncbi:MAG TPA: hypothetical protein VF201_06590 [Nitrolancea sp.]